MEQCKECEMAIYCFSDSSSWVFRTKQEMEEKKDVIANCAIHCQLEQAQVSRANSKLR
jgi:hypothetical protein